MPSKWPTFLKWGAVLALALLALASAPHLHDELEGNDDSCVLCHVHHTPYITSIVDQAVPEPVAVHTDVPFALEHARDEALEGHGSRAPPA